MRVPAGPLRPGAVRAGGAGGRPRARSASTASRSSRAVAVRGHGRAPGPPRLHLAGHRRRPRTVTTAPASRSTSTTRPTPARFRTASSGTWKRTPPASSGSPPAAVSPPGIRPPTASSARRASAAGTSAPCGHSKKDNVLWIATRDSGLLRLRRGHRPAQASSRTTPVDAASLLDDHVYALAIDAKGRLWVGSEGGLDRLNANGRASRTSCPTPRIRPASATPRCAPCRRQHGRPLGRQPRQRPGPPGHRNRALRALPARRRRSPRAWPTIRCARSSQDADGRLWVGTSGGLDLLDAAHGTFAHYAPGRRQPDQPRRRPRPLPRPGPRRRAVGGDAPGRRATSGTR